jgi:hypothetical protein
MLLRLILQRPRHSDSGDTECAGGMGAFGDRVAARSHVPSTFPLPEQANGSGAEFIFLFQPSYQVIIGHCGQPGRVTHESSHGGPAGSSASMQPRSATGRVHGHHRPNRRGDSLRHLVDLVLATAKPDGPHDGLVIQPVEFCVEFEATAQAGRLTTGPLRRLARSSGTHTNGRATSAHPPRLGCSSAPPLATHRAWGCAARDAPA